ncbi:DUF4352 domain-containing protein [Heyndrickxia vini]|uniref:DUF4352 domain-containing protein n=1 Tax=Heyndrickxia vini TaxID=1476025 RepID=A0ABX7E3Z5_9BACI|nr:DUF4352 domain-containing protein [Heyndrickxia vini]QQZ10433.1 DUF4352 domain-containing protein [Heyndrickxia vini]
MRKIMCFVIAIIVCFSILSACQSSDNNKKASDKDNDKTSQVKENDSNKLSSNNEKESKQEDNSKNSSSTGNFKDQENLKIGDTGKAKSTVGKYEITIHSIKMKDEIEGQAPMFDHLFIAEITVKNIGDQPIDAKEPVGTLEITEDLNGSGSGDDSQFFNSVKTFEGTIEPGKTVTGEAVFDGREADTYYIRTISGLIASKTVKNNTVWSFKKSEAK